MLTTSALQQSRRGASPPMWKPWNVKATSTNVGTSSDVYSNLASHSTISWCPYENWPKPPTFADCIQKNIRDQIIEGLREDDTVEDLLQVKDLILATAITKCQGQEAAKRQRAEMVRCTPESSLIPRLVGKAWE